jgi:hypothetical protein
LVGGAGRRSGLTRSVVRLPGGRYRVRPEDADAALDET